MLAIALLLTLSTAQAQKDTTRSDGAPQQKVEMADLMRSEGKIYVVVGIILIVLAVVLVYLFVLDRNVKKLEKQLADRQK